MRFVCLIASHLSTQQRVDLLYECLLSALYGLKADQIIISCSGQVEPKLPESNKILVLKQPQKKLQFQHLK